MSIQKLSGVVLLAGSLLFLTAAFSPVARVFSTPAADKKLEIIRTSGNAWAVEQVLFALGSIVTAIGVGLAASSLRTQPSSYLLSLSAIVLAAGALPWSRSVYLRAIDPGAFVAGSLPAWHFATYTLLTQAALIILGVAVLRLQFHNWVGWLLIGGATLCCLLYVVFKDMPPFVYYLLTLAAAIEIFRMG